MSILPKIMGILNATPDSFSDGGKFNQLRWATERIQEMVAQGAGIIDLGGEATGPSSPDVSSKRELERITPIVDWVSKSGLSKKNILFSIDTYKAPVAEYALAHGFNLVNDVTAMRGDSRMLSVVLKYQPYVVLMYAKDPSPRTSLEMVEYDDAVLHIKNFLQERAQWLMDQGFPKEKIILDPGMGLFISANPKYSFEVVERLGELKVLGFAILVGLSRKGFLGGKVESRDPSTVEWSLKALKNGADIVRVHNVALMKENL